jgi:hypothetical protein
VESVADVPNLLSQRTQSQDKAYASSPIVSNADVAMRYRLCI